MICSQVTNELGRFPRIETVYEPDAQGACSVTVNRFGGIVVNSAGQFERLGSSNVYDLPLAAAK